MSITANNLMKSNTKAVYDLCFGCKKLKLAQDASRAYCFISLNPFYSHWDDFILIEKNSHASPHISMHAYMCLHALICLFLFCKVAFNRFHPERCSRGEADVLASRHSDHHHLSVNSLLSLSLSGIISLLLCSLHISSCPGFTIHVLALIFFMAWRWI